MNEFSSSYLGIFSRNSGFNQGKDTKEKAHLLRLRPPNSSMRSQHYHHPHLTGEETEAGKGLSCPQEC